MNATEGDEMDTCQSCGRVKSPSGHYCKEFAIDQVADILKRADRHGVSIDYVVRNAVSHAEAEKREPAVEELAAEILKGAGLEAELYHTGGGIFCAQVERFDGVGFVGVFQGEDTAAPFAVVLREHPDDEKPQTTCGPAELVDVVRAKL
jgi:hypothetical protein